MNNVVDPKRIIEQSSMSRAQYVAVAVCILLNALDGFDVLAISFASPGISEEWSISRAALGVVLAMELCGMAIGSIILGGVADKIGRRPTIIGCLIVMTVGMFLAAIVHSVNEMLIVRFVTGLGIGGMLACVNAMVAEFSNAKNRNFCVILMAAGYPIGATIGGAISTVLLETYDWRAIFIFGSITTATFLAVVLLWLPESIEYLISKQPKGALERINKTLKKMGHTLITSLPERGEEQKKSSYGVLFSPKYRNLTMLLVVAYFALIMTFYYILKWIPKIVVDMGFDPSSAGSVLVWANVGGAIGSIIIGLITKRFNLSYLLIGVLVMSFVMMTVFGLGQSTLMGLSLIAAVTGFFTNASVVACYALIASTFPAEVRASGTGIVIGVGRGGAALAPIVAGLLFTAGYSLFFVSVLMGTGALIAALCVIGIGLTLKKQKALSH